MSTKEETTRVALEAIWESKGFDFKVTGRLAPRQCPGSPKPGPGSARVAFRMTCGRESYVGEYGAGSWIVAREVLERPELRCRLPQHVPSLGLGVDVRALERASRKYGRCYTLDEKEALIAAAAVWEPRGVDVLGCMLQDVLTFAEYGPGGCTLREWLDEGLAEGMNAFDALDTFEALGREWRFLARVLGDELEAAIEIAREL